MDLPPKSLVQPLNETKALLNNSGPRYKRSRLERQMNCDVLWCVLLLICMSLFSAIGKSPWRAVRTGHCWHACQAGCLCLLLTWCSN